MLLPLLSLPKCQLTHTRRISVRDNFRVAIDALGGDNAPAAPVEGAVLAARNNGAEVLLVGNSNIV